MLYFNIGFSSTLKNLPLVGISLYSTLVNNSSYFFNVYIIHPGEISQNNIDVLIKKTPLLKLKNFKIHILDVSQLFDLSTYINKNNITNIESLIPLFLPQMIPHIDSILYMNHSCLCNGDILNILSLEPKNSIFIGDCKTIKNFSNYLFCGFMVINIKNFIQKNVSHRLMEYMENNNISNVEIAINNLYQDDISQLPNGSNIYTISLGLENDINIPFKNIKILHFKDFKPFYTNKINKYKYKKQAFFTYYTYGRKFVKVQYLAHFHIYLFYVYYASYYISRIKKFFILLLKKYIPIKYIIPIKKTQNTYELFLFFITH